MKRMINSYWIAGILVMSALLIASTGTIVLADNASDARLLVDKAGITLSDFKGAKNMDAFRDLLKDAKGIFIAPQVLKGAFIVGASGGSGVFMVRDGASGKWSEPAFYTIGAANFGLQSGRPGV